MMDSPELGQINKKTVENAKQKAPEDVRAAANTQARQDLARKIIVDLQRSKGLAHDYNTHEYKSGIQSPESLQKGQEVLQSLAYAAEAAKAGIRISRTDEGQALLVKIADHDLRFVGTATSIVEYLGDYLIGAKPIVNGGKLDRDFEKAFKKMLPYNPDAPQIYESLVELAREGRLQGLTEQQLEKSFEHEHSAIAEEEDGDDRETDQSAVLLKRKLHVNEKLHKSDRDFFNSIKTPQKFHDYVFNIRAGVEAELRSKNPAYDRLDHHVKEKLLAEEISSHIRDRVKSVIYRIYDGVLVRKKNVAFDHAESEGTFYANPKIFFDVFVDRISDLRGEHHDFSLEALRTLAQPKREIVRGRLDEIGNILPDYEKVLPEFEIVNEVQDFLVHLAEYGRGEKKRLSYGYNLEFLIRNAAFDPKEGLMKTIAGFAKGIENSEIDEIFADKGNEIVQRAILMFELKHEQKFHNQGWEKDPMLVDTFFQNLTNLQQDALNEFRERYSGKYEDWEIQRSVFNAQLMLLGVYFKSFHHASYADPWHKGHVTVVGARELVNMAIYDTGLLGKRFQDPELLAMGVDWMPYNINIPLYNWEDHKLWQKAYENSYDRGKAGYSYLIQDGKFVNLAGTGEDMLRVKLLADIGNITEAGGLDTIARWRIYYGYVDWIRDNLKSDLSVNWSNKNGLVEMWKKVENIGSDVLENLTLYKYVLGLAPEYDFKKSKGKKMVTDTKPGEKPDQTEVDKRDNLRNLFGFFYDRYFNTSIVGRTFIKKDARRTMSKDEYLKLVLETMDDPDLYQNAKKEFLLKHLYNVFTVLMYERMPLKFVHLEKQRMTQNGSLLNDEIMKEVLGLEQGMTLKQIEELKPEEIIKLKADQGRRLPYDQGIDDLIFVQTELRLKTIEDMNDLKEKHGNLYGKDISRNRSDVNGGAGYVLSEAVIEELLKKEFFDEKHPSGIAKTYREDKEKGRKGFSKEKLNNRIEYAKKIHRTLTKKLTELPEKAAWEKKILADKKTSAIEKTRVEEIRESFMSRAEWFSQLYKGFEFGEFTSGGEFGFSPTSGELAFRFINNSASGNETIERMANFNAETAELTSKEWAGFLELFRKSKKERNLGEVLGKVWEVVTGARHQWGSTSFYADRLAAKLIQRLIFYYRKNDGPNLQLWDWATDHSSSFSEADTGGPRTGGAVYEFTKNDIDKAISDFEGASGLKFISHKPRGEHGREEPLIRRIESRTAGKEFGLLGRLAEQIAGHEIKLKPRQIRDWANEVSGNAIKHFHKANLAELLKWEVSWRILAAIAVIIAILAAKGFKEDFQVGTAKA